MKRDLLTMDLGFPDELIIDNFAGGGGTSTGLEAAFGRPVDIAINHDPEALAMHALNHPYTLHLCESVWDVDPIKVTGNQPVGLVWLSPDCKHFSKAKGSTPVSRDIRGLAWVGIRWALFCHPRAFALENVEEFKTWGPLMELPDGTLRPDPERKGETFQAFCGMLSTGVPHDHPALAEACGFLDIDPAGALAQRLVRGLGYDIDYRELRACDYDTPTIRKRLFFVGRRDHLPIVWPDPTTGDPEKIATGVAVGLKPWRTAAECIDFGIEARSIFSRPRPLAPNTLRRVAKGAWRYVLANPQPFIVGVGGRMGQSPARPTSKPAQTVTAKADACVAQPVLTPFLVGQGGPAYGGKPVSADRPLGAQTAENHRAVAVPVLAPVIMTNTTGHDSAPPTRPLATATTGGHHAVVAPVITPLRGTQESHLQGDSVEAPTATVSAGGTHHALVGAEMVAAHIQRDMGRSVGHAADNPLGTTTAGGGGKSALISTHLITIGYGERPGQDGRAHIVAAHLVDAGHGESCSTGARRWSDGSRAATGPLNSITASGSPSYVSAYHLMHLTHHGDRAGTMPASPLPTVTAAHRGEQAMVAACLEQANGGFYDGDGRPLPTPTSTITASGAQQRLITAYFIKYYGEGGQWAGADEPVHTLTTKARVGLVQTIQVTADLLAPELREQARLCAEFFHEHLPEHFPEPAEMIILGGWVLVDITLRMLVPRELYLAQGFPATYKIEEIPDPKLLFVNGHQIDGDPRLLPRIKLSKSAQVRMCGNSVCPPVAEALIKANFRHEALIKGVA